MPFSKLIIAMLACCFSLAASSETIEIKTVSQDGATAKYIFGNKAKPGICVEIIQALEKADPGIRFTGLEGKAVTARIENMIEAHEIDTFCGIVKSPERTARYAFLEPLVYSSNQNLYVRADDTVNVGSVEDLKKLGKDGIVLVTRGSSQEQFLKSIEGLSIDSATADNLQNLKKLEAGRGRFYYGADLNTAEGIQALGLQGKVKALPVKLRSAGIDYYFIASKKTDPKITGRIEAGLKKLQASGELAKIYKKYTE